MSYAIVVLPMKLNTITGEFQFEKWTISPASTLNEIVNSFNSDEIEPWYSNQDWTAYKLNLSKQYFLAIQFFKQKIEWIEIAFRGTAKDWTVTQKDIDATRVIVDELGGEHIYSWGRVLLSNDNKEGSVSAIISYSKSN